ncbi:PASTA domain-containing protein [Dactylosporangium sp. NPDC006015]|uniref:PASTA domain-containing protein n=1 Tax=Dactylosporangium sp. NPDC006015 TaxID=3154576 RepID=UPI0033B01103
MGRSERRRFLIVAVCLALVTTSACTPEQGRDGANSVPAYAKPPRSFADVLDQSGDRPVKADQHSLSVSRSAVSSRVTDDLGQGIVLRDGAVELTARSTGKGSGGSAAKGVVVFRDAVDGTDVAEQVLAPEAARIFYVVKSAAAPVSFDTAVSGATPVPAGAGIVLKSKDATVGAIPPSWAYDADGKLVPSHYEVHGNTVRLVVEHRTAGVAYPVVADPPFMLGAGGRLVGAQLLGGIFEWAAIAAITWGVVKFDSNGCLTLSTFASCALHPLEHDWSNKAAPKASAFDAKMPKLKGDRLPDAQRTLNQLGLRNVHLVDDTGKDRTVLDPKNWVVAAQSPAEGTTVHANTELTLRVRKPSDGEGGSGAAGAVPDVMCMNLQEAQDKLRDAGYRTTSKDHTTQGRRQVLDRNWLVVAQSPKPGTAAAKDTQVVMEVVKYGEPTGSSGCKS